MPKRLERWHRCRRWQKVLGVCPYSGNPIHDNEVLKRYGNLDPPEKFDPKVTPSLPDFVDWGRDYDIPDFGEDDLWRPDLEVPEPEDSEPDLPPEERPSEEPSSPGTTESSPPPREQPENILNTRWNNIPNKYVAERYTVERLRELGLRPSEDSEDYRSDRRKKQDKDERRIIPYGYRAKRTADPPIPKEAVPGGFRGWRYGVAATAAAATTGALYGLSRGGGGGFHFPSRPGEPNLTPSRY